jgi:hypothetical protein
MLYVTIIFENVQISHFVCILFETDFSKFLTYIFEFIEKIYFFLFIVVTCIYVISLCLFVHYKWQ